MNSNFDNVKVSIIVPCYNVENYINKCLNSIVGQTLKEIQIICVNDGSTDTTLSIISEFAEKDCRITVIDKPNSGYGDSLNIAMSEASGEYIGIVESDDFIEPEMFGTLYNKAKEYDADVVKSNFWLYWGNEDKEEFFECIYKDECNKIIDPLLHDNGSLYNRKASIWSAIYRRKYLTENKIQFLTTPGASFQDISFTFKVLSATKKMVCIYEPFLHYRQDNENSSINNVEKKIPYFFKEYDEIVNFINNADNGKEYLFPLYCAKFYDDCIWNYERSNPAGRYPFLKIVSGKFKDILSEIDPEKIKFGDCWWKKRDIVRIAEDPYQYHMWRNDERYDQNKGSIHYTEPAIPAGATVYPDAYENRTQPAFSVIIPIFNVEKFLPSALESLLYQSYKDLEIICINDGSTDHSLSVIKTYSEIDKRIIIINQQHSSAAEARNVGIEASTGKYIVFLDGDDYLSENTFEILSKYVRENNDPDMIEYGSVPFPESPAASKWLYNVLTTHDEHFNKVDQDTFLKKEYLRTFCWRYCIKSQFIKEHHISFPAELILGEDAIFVMHCLMQANGVVILSDKLYFYRHHRSKSDSVTTAIYKDSERYAELQFMILERMLHDAFSLFGFEKSPSLFECCSYLIEGCLNGLSQPSKVNYITKFLSLMKEYELDQCVWNCSSNRQKFYNDCLETVKKESRKKQMANTIEQVSKEQCTGCGACHIKCPHDAIMMEYDEEGFLFPVIDPGKCVNCGMCVNACPVCRNLPKNEMPQIYAVMDLDEERKRSSSGGMFGILARYILQKGGVVYGAAYADDYLSVKHKAILTEENLNQLRGSKYVQSDIVNCYAEVESYLKQEKPVLFSGTPCQVDGLRSYLGREYPLLLLADVICHGAPSPMVYKKYINEMKPGENLEKVDFREKEYWGWGTATSIWADGKIYRNDCYKDCYWQAFLQGVSVRKCCGSCKYAAASRCGDFSLGDFWGISELEPKLDDKLGTSMVLVNSERGKEVWKEVQENIHRKEKMDLTSVVESARKNNGQLVSPKKLHWARKDFFELIKNKSVKTAYEWAVNSHFDVGITGWWYNENYGGALTYFALNRVIRSMGFNVLMIAKCSDDPHYKPKYQSIPYRFAMKHYRISRNYTHSGIAKLNEHCDAFVSGSDQMFNPYLWQYSGPQYYLNYVSAKNRMISYASSFGNGFQISDEKQLQYSKWLHRFDALSVREDYAVEICEEKYQITPKKVLDPVFLCDVKEYEKLADSTGLHMENPYFVSFFLDPDDEKREAILFLERKLGLPSINLINAAEIEENARKLNLPDTKAGADIEEWLYWYKNASFVITDSFHGTCFSIIFRKPFISVANRQRGERRFVSLLKEFGLTDRLVYDLKEIRKREDLFKPTDYERVYQAAGPKIRESYDWLENALKGKRNYDLIALRQRDDEIAALKEKIASIESGS